MEVDRWKKEGCLLFFCGNNLNKQPGTVEAITLDRCLGTFNVCHSTLS